MPIRTYNISLSETVYEFKSYEIEPDTARWFKVITGYPKDYRGYCCSTEKPPHRTVHVSGDEIKIESINLINSQTLKVEVQFELAAKDIKENNDQNEIVTLHLYDIPKL